MTLYIDDQEVDQQGEFLSVSVTLRGKIPDTDKEVIAFINGAEKWNALTCHFVVGEELDVIHGVTDADGVFTAFPTEEDDA